MYVIKRYSNRKLYSTHNSRYVTLLELSDLVRQGQDFCVVDNATEKDLTSIILTQIIYEEEKRSPRLPSRALIEIIRTGLLT